MSVVSFRADPGKSLIELNVPCGTIAALATVGKKGSG